MGSGRPPAVKAPPEQPPARSGAGTRGAGRVPWGQQPSGAVGIERAGVPRNRAGGVSVPRGAVKGGGRCPCSLAPGPAATLSKGQPLPECQCPRLQSGLATGAHGFPRGHRRGGWAGGPAGKPTPPTPRPRSGLITPHTHPVHLSVTWARGGDSWAGGRGPVRVSAQSLRRLLAGPVCRAETPGRRPPRGRVGTIRVKRPLVCVGVNKAALGALQKPLGEAVAGGVWGRAGRAGWFGFISPFSQWSEC